MLQKFPSSPSVPKGCKFAFKSCFPPAPKINRSERSEPVSVSKIKLLSIKLLSNYLSI